MMDIGVANTTTVSRRSEGFARPYEPQHTAGRSLEDMLQQLDGRNAAVLSVLAKTFQLPASATGAHALLDALGKDLVLLRTILNVPHWVERIEALRHEFGLRFSDQHARDRASLSSQPKNPLREYLTMPTRDSSPNLLRAVRASRGLLSLKLLSRGECITADVSDEIRRWLVGKGPALGRLGDIDTEHLRQLHRAYPLDHPCAMLLTSLIDALEIPLPDPFNTQIKVATYIAPAPTPAPEKQHREPAAQRRTHVEPRDPLAGFLAEAGNAGVRIFSGVPTYRGLHPEELEVVFPRVIAALGGLARDEVLAAAVTLLSRIMPTRFKAIPFSAHAGAGIWIDISAGHLCVNLDAIVASHRHCKPLPHSPEDRHICIPLPREVAAELCARCKRHPGATALNQLFVIGMAELAISTKSFLRSLAASSHRPTLTRLSHTWARHLLSLCGDEAYASALGIDFTLGTTANFNYVLLRASRIRQIFCQAYRSIGFSGELTETPIDDVGSLRLPDEAKVRAFVTLAFEKAGNLITTLPKRTHKTRLMAVHNELAPLVHAVLKFFIAGRNLVEETITGSRIDASTGLLINADKRSARYHERRLAVLPEALRSWLVAYCHWLRLLAYRLHLYDPDLAHAIATTVAGRMEGDCHPLFFRFDEAGKVAPLGACDLENVYRVFGISNNGGRHFLDWLLRDHGIDSAAIMAFMGRGNPGQEAFGSWSAAVPLDTLRECATVIEDWLQETPLAPPPVFRARQMLDKAMRKQLPTYIPALLQTAPEHISGDCGPAEPCPFGDEVVVLAAQYERIFRGWRRQGPSIGWLGVALSLVIEDGVVVMAELEGILNELQTGTIYRHDRSAFCDARCFALGIRRVWMSEATVRLLYAIEYPAAKPLRIEELDVAARNFVGSILPAVGARGLGYVMACAATYHSLRAPGVLHAWMRGFRFARTSRPETVARHLIGTIEHPKFDASRRHRPKTRDSHTIQRSLNRAARSVERGASHKTELSGLDAYLSAVLSSQDEGEYEALFAGYLQHLCRTQRNVHTVARYALGAREFIERAALALEEHGPGQVDWRELVTACLPDGNGGQVDDPARAAINHALNWLGVDLHTYRRPSAPPAACGYAEMPSSREIETAIRLLNKHIAVVADDCHLAAVALRLLDEHPNRWDAIAHLRLHDLALDAKHPHIVITKESGAALKTANAQRVLLLRNPRLIEELKAIRDRRAARFPGDPLVPLLGDGDDPRGNVTAHRVHVLIAEALSCATGSPVIRPHDTRDGVITRRMHALISPRQKSDISGTLALRQGMYRLAVDTGHGAPDVTVENYGHGLDMLRRAWITKINTGIDCPPSTRFVSRLTGVAEATYRQRRCRNGSGESDLLENLDSARPLKAGAKVVLLANLVSATETCLPWTGCSKREHELIGSAIYIGLRLLLESTESAHLASRLSAATATMLEVGLNRLNRRRAFPLRARNDIDRDAFMDALHDSRLPVAMHRASAPSAAINRIGMAMKCAGDPWTFASPEDVLDLAPWISTWKANDIEIAVSIKPSKRSAVDEYALDCLRDAGIERPRATPARHFRRGVGATLKFLKKRGARDHGTARASPQISFIATVCAITLTLST